MSEQLYYIQNQAVCGNCCFWWKPDSCGYTSNLDEAGKYDSQEAARIERGRPGFDKAWPVELIDSFAARHVDIQKLLSRDQGGNQPQQGDSST